MDWFQYIMPTTTRITDSIAIYLPPNVTRSYSAGYNNAEMGIIGLQLQLVVNLLDAMRRNDYAAASIIRAVPKTFLQAALELGSEFIGTLQELTLKD